MNEANKEETPARIVHLRFGFSISFKDLYILYSDTDMHNVITPK